MIVFRKFLVRDGRGVVVAYNGWRYRFLWHRPSIKRGFYGWAAWLGPVGIGWIL